ncbi:hypothetical protein CPB86DRAFT_117611 [Serendipita vermifera]|nr:hypothetical protein CPB86DRAFT_117611 [Serendipita vermifera]
MSFQRPTNRPLLPQEDALDCKTLNAPYKYHRRLEWKTSLTLFVPIVISAGFAIGHHYYLASLHEGPVGGVQSQRTVKAINNTFPTIITALLCISLATAILELVCSHSDGNIFRLILSITVMAQSTEYRFTSDIKAAICPLQSSFLIRADRFTKTICSILWGLLHHSRVLFITLVAYICARSVENHFKFHNKH